MSSFPNLVCSLQRASGSNISVYDPNLRNGKKRDANSCFRSPEDDFGRIKKICPELDAEEGRNPSRVLFVRFLPRDVTEHEIAVLAVPFGPISNLVLTRKNGQALLEMVHLDSARDMLDYYTTVYPPRIRGKLPLKFAYSKYPVLNTTPPNQLITEAISLANQRHVDVVTPPHYVILAQVDHAPPGLHFGYRQFHHLFKGFGRILRIVAFPSGSSQKALIEFEEPVSAVVAVMQADGTTFRPEDAPSDLRCTIRVELSRQQSLEVRQEDEYCRDFTISATPRHRMSEHMFPPSSNEMFRSYRQMDRSGSMDNLSNVWSNISLLDFVTEERLNSLDPNSLSELASRMVKPLLKAALVVGAQQSTFMKSQAEVLEHLCPQNMSSMLTRVQQSTLMGSFGSSGHSVPASEDSRKTAPSAVVYVTNLNQERANADALFTLFGVYGDVQRVKLLHNRKDAALIQFTDVAQAKRGKLIVALDDYEIDDNTRIRVSFSKSPIRK
ncbi:Polypyrimidine tract-binding protein 2 [Fasciola gigantica]|uniref:Polypyrimidine tract-binding protein 2 n=1 Tax=Fasciola gigantica TaxID=46835 RepID=A0A504YB18_FASGI|nr:Polypyrimidine tract-binding protein 2 [Fasciola gigantica]